MLFLFLIQNILILTIISVGCKKEKNNASKLKPRDMSKEKPAAPSPDTTQKPPVASPAQEEKKPAADAEKSMAAREANDNETIDEAPSKWGAV